MAVNPDVAAEDLLDLVDREVEILEELAFELIVIRSLAQAGEAESVAVATDQVSQTVEILRLTGLLRATHSAELAAQHGLDPCARLGEIVEALPDPTSVRAAEARRRLVAAVTKTRDLASKAGVLLGERVALVQEAITSLSDAPPSTYGNGGASGATAGSRAQLMRRVL